ncbi:MAG: alpha/beta hydrolase [Phycisphaerales bacterium]|nr:alpha/beta hydrolase [Phycisphaerales bacterium]
MASADNIPLLLFTGMVADERLFEGQIEAFGHVIAPRWIEAHPNETIREYARRMVSRVGLAGPCFVGGASFGGVVAQEAAQFLDAKAVFLIGSIKHPRELPPLIRIWKFMGHFPDGPRRRLMSLAAMFARPFVPRPTARRMRQIAQPDMRFARWASMALLRWKPTPIDPRVPIFHIHGDADGTLPVKYTRPDVIVPGADHILSYRRAAAVNAFLCEKMAEVTGGGAG